MRHSQKSLPLWEAAVPWFVIIVGSVAGSYVIGGPDSAMTAFLISPWLGAFASMLYINDHYGDGPLDF